MRHSTVGFIVGQAVGWRGTRWSLRVGLALAVLAAMLGGAVPAAGAAPPGAGR